MNWYTDRLPYAHVSFMCVFINKCWFGMQTAISRCAQCLRQSNAKKTSMFSYFELCIYALRELLSSMAGTLCLALNWYWYGDVAPASTDFAELFLVALSIRILIIILFIYNDRIEYIFAIYGCASSNAYLFGHVYCLYRNQLILS